MRSWCSSVCLNQNDRQKPDVASAQLIGALPLGRDLRQRGHDAFIGPASTQPSEPPIRYCRPIPEGSDDVCGPLISTRPSS